MYHPPHTAHMNHYYHPLQKRLVNIPHPNNISRGKGQQSVIFPAAPTQTFSASDIDMTSIS